GEIIKIKRLHKFIKNKNLNLRDWMIASMVVNVGICLIITGLLSLFYGELFINIAFLGLFGYLMFFSLYIKTNRFLWLAVGMIMFCCALSFLLF
ncbi:MAG: hypothetical protein ABF723_06310, partial [Lentilactobacillus hilgardii]